MTPMLRFYAAEEDSLRKWLKVFWCFSIEINIRGVFRQGRVRPHHDVRMLVKRTKPESLQRAAAICRFRIRSAYLIPDQLRALRQTAEAVELNGRPERAP